MTYVRTPLKREIVIDSIITIHYFEYMKDFVFHGESHNFWELLYVDKGSVQVRSGEDRVHLDAGDIIFHEPNEFHAIRSVGNASPNLVAISFTTHSPSIDFFRKKSWTLTMEERTVISHIISTARETLSTPMHLPSVEQIQIRQDAPFGSEQLILLYLELFLITLQRDHDDNTSLTASKSIPPFPDPSDTKSGRINEVIEYMQFHICEPLSISKICDALSISRSALQSLFHTEKNCGVMEYFNDLKIQRAREIIRDGTMNFTEIAYYLSYSSLQYFSKQFKNATGMSPSEYASSVKGISNSLKRPEDLTPPPVETKKFLSKTLYILLQLHKYLLCWSSPMERA